MAQLAQQVMLAQSWTEDSGVDPTGYWMAEKLDGVRAYFDGTNFYSRAGNKFHVPAFFSKNLPKNQHLDGELWLGRGRFQQCISIVRNQKDDRADEWKEIIYLVFDAPQMDLVYEKRLDYLKSIIPTFGKDQLIPSAGSLSQAKASNVAIPEYARLVPVQKCLSKTHLMRELKHVQDHGGEGIMLRAPRSRYEFKRSRTLLKVKTFFDEEAIITGHVRGSGKNSSRMGHLEVRTPDGRCFSVGSGFTDAQRIKPPKVGTVITFKFQELSDRLIPRFPTFVGERIDINWSDYCKTYKAPIKKAATPTKVATLLKEKSLGFQDEGFNATTTTTTTTTTTSTTVTVTMDDDGDDQSTDNDNGLDDANMPIDPPSPSDSSTSNSSSPAPSASTNKKRTRNDSPDGSSKGGSPKREPCRYGIHCYRKNPDHHKRFSHPHK